MKIYEFTTNWNQTVGVDGDYRHVMPLGDLPHVSTYEDAYAFLVYDGAIKWGEEIVVVFSPGGDTMSIFNEVEIGLVKQVGPSELSFLALSWWLENQGMTPEDMEEFLRG